MKIAKMSAQEIMAAKMEADLINKKVNHGRESSKGVADKDMFMKLLVTHSSSIRTRPGPWKTVSSSPRWRSSRPWNR